MRKPPVRKMQMKVLEQLNSWVESVTPLWLIVEIEPLNVFYTGCVCKLKGTEDLFYLAPNEGGGVFEFTPSENSTALKRTDAFTVVSFRKGEIALKLLEVIDRERFASAPRLERVTGESAGVLRRGYLRESLRFGTVGFVTSSAHYGCVELYRRDR